MAKLQFLTRGKNRSLNYRYSNGRGALNSTKALPFKMNINDKWGSKLQLTESNFDLNKILSEFKAYIITSTNDAIDNKICIDSGWLKKIQLYRLDKRSLIVAIK